MNLDKLKAHNTQGVRGWAVAVPHPSGDGSFYGAIVDGLDEQTAKLFAASPRLAAALQVIVDNGGIGPEDMFHDARDALALTKVGATPPQENPTSETSGKAARLTEKEAERLCAGDRVTWVDAYYKKNKRHSPTRRGVVSANRFPEIQVWEIRRGLRHELRRIFWNNLALVKPKPKKTR